MGERALSRLWLFWIVQILDAAAIAFLCARRGVEDSATDRDGAARHAALEPGELSRAIRELTRLVTGEALGTQTRGREGGRNRPCDCRA